MAIQIRRGTSALAQTSSEILKAGQPFYATDTGEYYVGDGNSTLQLLSPVAAGIGCQFTISESTASTITADGEVVVGTISHANFATLVRRGGDIIINHQCYFHRITGEDIDHALSGSSGYDIYYRGFLKSNYSTNIGIDTPLEVQLRVESNSNSSDHFIYAKAVSTATATNVPTFSYSDGILNITTT